MFASRFFAPTLRQAPWDAETESHKLMTRAGLIRKISPGVFVWLPMGLRIINKLKNLFIKKMDEIGGLELFLPALCPRELWEESGRWDMVGEEVFRIQDRNKKHLLLSLTHEEIITYLVSKDIRSYKELPLVFYYMGAKFRDEKRPAGGTLRTREFISGDIYSFHSDEENMMEYYNKIQKVYTEIFDLCGIPVTKTDGDAGYIGGNINHELVYICDNGSDTLLICPRCGYSAKEEVADFYREEPLNNQTPSPKKNPDNEEPPQEENYKDPIHNQNPYKENPQELLYTPDIITVKDLEEFTRIPSHNIIKALLYMADDKPIMILVRGDRDMSEARLKKLLKYKNLKMMDEKSVEEFTGGAPGFSGPVGIPKDKIWADYEIVNIKSGICGANKKDHHIKNVIAGRDFRVSQYLSLRKALAGDPCPHCKTPLIEKKGVEMAHCFALGDFYSRTINALFTDEKGDEKPVIMGCYGLGFSRLVSVMVEKHRDKNGIIFPFPVAPYTVAILLLEPLDSPAGSVAKEIYDSLTKKGIDVFLDDRNQSPGFKFKDADLIGYPLQVIIGNRALKENNLEIKLRSEGQKQTIPIQSAVEKVVEMLGGFLG